MSSYVDTTWFYQLRGRKIDLYVFKDYPTDYPDQLGRISVTYAGKTLEYPDEDITNGLRIEYTGFDETFVAESLEDTSARISGTTIAFVDGGGSSDTITDTGNGFVTAGFASTDKIRVIGSASNDGDYQLTGAVAGTLTVATGSFTAESAAESITIYQIPKKVADSSADETSHINLNRLLSLAVVDYLKSKKAENEGNIELKEYYLRQFYKKIGDNDSNKRKIVMQKTSSPYALL